MAGPQKQVSIIKIDHATMLIDEAKWKAIKCRNALILVLNKYASYVS